jgi:hypothetical protein
MFATPSGLADLRRFSQLLEEPEHFCRCGQQKVAKIVQCGEHSFIRKSTEEGPPAKVALSF